MSYNFSTLTNGLRVASEHLPAVESVTLCISFNAGARQETNDQHGLAHLLEHMAFKGTQKRTARQIAEAFDDIGGAVNAYTSMERTVYYARVLKQHLPIAAEILSDILRNSAFSDDELKKEQEVIVQEIGMHHDSPEDLIFDQLHEVVYGTHPLGRTILGTTDSVRHFTADHLRDFVATHYHAPTMVVSAAGNVQHSELVSLMEEHFDGITTQGAQAKTKPDFFSGEQHITRNELEQNQVMLGYKGVTAHDKLYYPTQLLSLILGGGMSSRLFQEVREKRGLAYSVSSFLTTYEDSGMFGIYAATSASHVKELLTVLEEQTQSLLEGISAEEITRAKNQQLAALLMRRESVTAVAEWIARHLQDYNHYRNGHELAERVEAITAQDLQQAAEMIFAQPVRACTTLGPSYD